MMNIFSNPNDYIESIKKIRIPKGKQKKFNSKSMCCAWVTKLCPARCKSCFFKSDMYHDGKPSEKYQFSDYGTERLIEFINDSNSSYLMLSGGGEPMIRRDIVNRVVREAVTDRIVVVTSGIWARTYKVTQDIIAELYKSFKSRTVSDNMTFVLRLSVDSFHYESLGFNILDNIISVFRNDYRDEPNFQLRIHTMQNDATLEMVAEKIGNCKVIYNDIESVSDNKEIIKILPKQATLVFDDGFKIFVGCSKLFLSNLKLDINNLGDDIQKALDVFEEDMSMSEYGNPSIVTNCDGSLGIDFWIDYNGNVTTWGNQQWDSLYNIYTDTYEDVVKGTFDNIISYSFLDKGYYYRERIIRKVNPRAVLRSKAINLRDYAGAFLIEEDRTKLYYAIQVVKDYLDDGVLTMSDIAFLPWGLQEAINLDNEKLKELYLQSDFDIVKQYLSKKDLLRAVDWEILFTLIKLGHYDICSENLSKAITHYNTTYGKNINSVEDVKDSDNPILYGEFHNRISFMKESARKLCLGSEED